MRAARVENKPELETRQKLRTREAEKGVMDDS